MNVALTRSMDSSTLLYEEKVWNVKKSSTAAGNNNNKNKHEHTA